MHAGYRRLGEVGHYVRKCTKGLVRVVSIDTKRRGYAHNILLPRVFAWLVRLAMLSLCIGIVLSGPCELFTPLRFELSTSGPPVLFNKSQPGRHQGARWFGTPSRRERAQSARTGLCACSPSSLARWKRGDGDEGDGEGNGGAANPLTVEAAADNDEFTLELTPGAARGGLASGRNRGKKRKRGGRQREDQAWRRREGHR